MPSAIWTLNNSLATLELQPFQALVDLRQPVPGLMKLSREGTALPMDRLLAVQREIVATGADQALVDLYVREHDLVATFAPDESGARIVIYWRCATERFPGGEVLVMDLQVSIETSQWLTRPRVRTCSDVRAIGALRLLDDRAGRFESIDVGQAATSSEIKLDHTSVILFRLDDRTSYAEMVHPADRHESCLTYRTKPVPEWQVGHALYGDELEKGVIVRSRIRGILADRLHDEDAAVEALRRLQDAPLPLTT